MAQTKAQLIDGKSATIEFSGGSSSAPAITFTGDTNTGIYSPGADQVAISTNAVQRVTVNSSGNVGIGIASPQRSVHIHNSTDARLKLSNDTTGANIYDGFEITDAGSIVQWETTGIKFYTNNGTAVDERARIDSSGRLLVGTSTATADGGILQLSSGITFPAAQVASTNPNTLDDYEEGTWSPAFGGYASVTYTAQAGRYIKVGKIVYVYGAISWSARTIGTNVHVYGFPFSRETGTIGNNANAIYVQFANNTAYAQLLPYLATDLWFATGTGAQTASTDPYGAAGVIYFSGCYEANG